MAGGPWPRRFSAWQDLLSPAAAAVSVSGLGLPARSGSRARAPLFLRCRLRFTRGVVGGPAVAPGPAPAGAAGGGRAFGGPVWWASRAVPRGGVGVARPPAFLARRFVRGACARVRWGEFIGSGSGLRSRAGRHPCRPVVVRVVALLTPRRGRWRSCVAATGAVVGLAVGPGFRFPPLPAPPLSLRARAPTPAAPAASGGCGLSEPPLPPARAAGGGRACALRPGFLACRLPSSWLARDRPVSRVAARGRHPRWGRRSGLGPRGGSLDSPTHLPDPLPSRGEGRRGRVPARSVSSPSRGAAVAPGPRATGGGRWCVAGGVGGACGSGVVGGGGGGGGREASLGGAGARRGGSQGERRVPVVAVAAAATPEGGAVPSRSGASGRSARPVCRALLPSSRPLLPVAFLASPPPPPDLCSAAAGVPACSRSLFFPPGALTLRPAGPAHRAPTWLILPVAYACLKD